MNKVALDEENPKKKIRLYLSPLIYLYGSIFEIPRNNSYISHISVT